jgi:hypothetical protein
MHCTMILQKVNNYLTYRGLKKTPWQPFPTYSAHQCRVKRAVYSLGPPIVSPASADSRIMREECLLCLCVFSGLERASQRQRVREWDRDRMALSGVTHFFDAGCTKKISQPHRYFLFKFEAFDYCHHTVRYKFNVKINTLKFKYAIFLVT